MSVLYFWILFCQRRDDIVVTDMVADMVANIEVDMVADIDINIDIKLVSGVG